MKTYSQELTTIQEYYEFDSTDTDLVSQIVSLNTLIENGFTLTKIAFSGISNESFTLEFSKDESIKATSDYNPNFKSDSIL